MSPQIHNRLQNSLNVRICHFLIVMILFPMLLCVIFILTTMLIKPNESGHEYIDLWCDQYQPTLTYNDCLDGAGL
jgi:hypothetical protein